MRPYTEHQGKAVDDSRFSHMMAIALDPSADYKQGVLRCITSRKGGDIEFLGSVDRSELHTVFGDTLEKFTVGERLQIKNEDEIVESLSIEGLDYLGLEDPDIFIDEETGLAHLYFTMPFVSKIEGNSRIHLGHAVGKDINSLEMTAPVLKAEGKNTAKEVSIVPVNSKGIRFNLFESSSIEEEVYFSTIRIGIASDMNKSWEFGEIIFHPGQEHIPWAAGHASPGPFFSRDFIDVGEGRLLGIMNGRGANEKIGDKTKYSPFVIGLFIYDYENGKIDWVSPEPLIQDSQAKTITFASQLVETAKGEGLLYAHVDDSFVRAYTVKAEDIKSLLF